MPHDQNPDDERGSGGSTWRIAELMFGGGVIVWALTASISSIWWAATTDTKIQNLQDKDSTIISTINGLDNVTLGNRLTAVETKVSAQSIQLNTIDNKIDRLLQRTTSRNDPN